MISSQERIIGGNPLVWITDQEALQSFMSGGVPLDKKMRRWWTYLAQHRLVIKHIPGATNELTDFLSRESFDSRLGLESEALARDAFQRMDIHLDLATTEVNPQECEGWQARVH